MPTEFKIRKSVYISDHRLLDTSCKTKTIKNKR